MAESSRAAASRKRGRGAAAAAPQLPPIRYAEPEVDPDIAAEEAEREAREEGVEEQPDIRMHPLLLFAPDTEEMECLERIIDLDHHQPRTIDWELMGTLGQRDRLQQLLSPRWRRLVDATDQQYQELTLEFFSTFQHRSGSLTDDYALAFSLGRQQRHLSISQFTVHMGLYTEEETTQPIFTKSLHGVFTEARPQGVTPLQLAEFWITIADGSFRPSIPATHIRNPVIRFLHRILACTVVGRYMGIEKVSQLDLFALYCLMGGHQANLATFLISSLTRQRGRCDRSRLAMGTYIARLARSLGVFTDYPPERLTPGPPAARFRYDDMQQMGVCPYTGDMRFVDVRPVERRPVPQGVAPEDIPLIGVPPPRQTRPTARARAAAQQAPPGPPADLAATLQRIEAEQVTLRVMVQSILDHLGIPPPPPPQ